MKWQQKHTSLVVIAIGFSVLYLVFKNYLLLAPVIIAAIGFAISPLGEMIHHGWLMLAKALGYINSRIILSILFFLMLSPLALLRKLFQRKQVSPQSLKSFFTPRNHVYIKEDFQNPW